MSAYRHRSVLVIGGLGFIGVNLTRRLAGEGARVVVLTPSRERHADEAAEFERRGARLIEGDVRDPNLVQRLVSEQEVIFNLSGQSGAVRSMEDPWNDLDVNLRGNLVLLEAIREVNPAAKLVLAGSRLQYGKPGRVPVAEDDERAPLCLHAIHKQTAEEYLRLYSRLFGLRSSVARVTNPFGPGQPSGRTAYGIINRLIHLAVDDQPLTLYGDGTQQRDYVFVDDVVDALLLLGDDEPRSLDGQQRCEDESNLLRQGDCPAGGRAKVIVAGEASSASMLADPKRSLASDGRVYNVGSSIGTRMVDVARLIVDVAGSGRIEHVPWPPLAEQIETGDFVADVSRIRDELGWRPRVSLRDGIERTVAFYRQRVIS